MMQNDSRHDIMPSGCLLYGACNWWLRSTNDGSNFRNVNTSGGLDNNNASNANGVVPGFGMAQESFKGEMPKRLPCQKERASMGNLNTRAGALGVRFLHGRGSWLPGFMPKRQEGRTHANNNPSRHVF